MKNVLPEAVEAANRCGVNPESLVNRARDEFRAEPGELEELALVRYEHYCKQRKCKYHFRLSFLCF